MKWLFFANSEEGECAGCVHIFFFELLLAHGEHQYALYEGHDADDCAGNAACDEREHEADDAGAYFAAVEVVASEVAEQDGQQGCHSAASAAGARVENVVLFWRCLALLLVGVGKFVEGWRLVNSAAAVWTEVHVVGDALSACGQIMFFFFYGC